MCRLENIGQTKHIICDELCLHRRHTHMDKLYVKNLAGNKNVSSRSSGALLVKEDTCTAL
jgi:hypothetical protein